MTPIISKTAHTLARKTPAPAPEPTPAQLDALAEKLEELTHLTLLQNRPDYRAKIQAGSACAPTRALAREVYISGFHGLELTKRANAFDTKFPTEAAYMSDFKQLVAKFDAANSPAPAPSPGKPTSPAPTPAASAMQAFAADPSKPYPSFLLVTNRSEIAAVAAAAGVPVSTRLSEVIAEADKSPSNLVEFAFSWGGRKNVAFVIKLTPHHSENEVGKYVTRLALASFLDAEDNEGLSRSWLSSIRNAMRDRNDGLADRAIIAAGSPTGF